MQTDFYKRIKDRFTPRALVLMYHRVTELTPDIWKLAVRPAHFEQHLQVLKKNWHVLPLPELVERYLANNLKQHQVALTFDDGYADNYLNARPLLEQYQIAATFFICTGNIGQPREFWWDELEHIILHSPQLPQHLTIDVANDAIRFDLQSESCLSKSVHKAHQHWKAFDHPPPTLRSKLFLLLWQALKNLPDLQQQQYLKQLKEWAHLKLKPRDSYRSMAEEQLLTLGQSRLFTIGAHTVSHPNLSRLRFEQQEQEVLQNKIFLESRTSRSVAFMAYPYGSYNTDTLAVLAKLDLRAAFTTQGAPVTPSSKRFQLGRMLVDDWDGATLDKYLKLWLKSY